MALSEAISDQSSLLVSWEGKGGWPRATGTALTAPELLGREKPPGYCSPPATGAFGPSVVMDGVWPLYTQGRNQFDHTGLLVCRKEIWFSQNDTLPSAHGRQKHGPLHSVIILWLVMYSKYFIYTIKDPVVWQLIQTIQQTFIKHCDKFMVSAFNEHVTL